jgi:DNA-directed RNA polymerase subunit RPC12/RpoP
MEGVLELVIDDAVEPSFKCVRCGHILVHGSIPLTAEGAQCPYCGGLSRLAELAGRKAGESLRLLVPPGLSVWECGSNWRIDISMRSARFAWPAFAGGAGLLFEFVHAAALFRETSGDDPFGRFQSLLLGGLLAAALGLLGCAAYWIWGRYSVSALDGEGSVFRGLGRFGTRRTFWVPVVNGICFRRVLGEGSWNHEIEKHVIRLEGVGFYLDFADDLTRDQQIFLALFLAQKVLQRRAEPVRATS